MPSGETQVELDGVKIIAHRGASGYRPELTLDAYELALRQKADGVECDIQLSADGEVVVMHDDTVDRTTDGTGRVDSLTLAELQELNAGTAERPQPVLSLRELLGVIRDSQTPDYRPELFIETKRLTPRRNRDGRLEQALQRELVVAGLADSPLIHLISFDHGSLARFRRINPGVHRTWLRKEYRGWTLLRHLEPAAVAPAQGFSVTRARRAAGDVSGPAPQTYLFTLNREDDLLWAYRHGVQWVATDYPDRAREVVAGAVRMTSGVRGTR